MNTQITHYYGNKLNLKKVFLDTLKRIGVIAPACRESGISRSTFYRWRIEDPDFDISCLESIQEAYDTHKDEMDRIPEHKRSWYLKEMVS